MSITANRQCVRCKRRMILYSPLCPDCQELLTPNYTSLYDGPHPVTKEQFIERAFPPTRDLDELIPPAPKEHPVEYINIYEGYQGFQPGRIPERDIHSEFEQDLIANPDIHKVLNAGRTYQPRPPIRQPKPRFRLRHLAGIIALHLLVVFALEAWGERPIERLRQAIVQFIHLEKP